MATELPVLGATATNGANGSPTDSFTVKTGLAPIGVDYVDESEVLTPADYANHIDKWQFTVPFVCGATNLGEALRRITEGAAMIRSKGEAGTGDVVEADRLQAHRHRRDPPPHA
ncbi:hypothetical protein VE04_10111, partial [Pseudogymnoascus sp. 24MN13]